MLKILTFLFLTTLINFGNSQCNLLSISGAGSHITLQGGIIQNLLVTQNKNYTAFNGVSAGSLLSYWLASSNSNESQIQKISDLYNILVNLKNSDIYTWNDLLFIWELKSIFDTSPLRNTLVNLSANRKLVSPLAVGSVSLLDGELYIFNNTQIENDPINYLMASSAIPVGFPPITIGNNIFIDGGTAEDFLTDFSLCADNYPINLDIVLSYSIINKVDFNNANNYNIFNLAGRLFSIADFNYFNHFISDTETIDYLCNNNVNITIYQPNSDLSVSILDFTQGAKLWTEGYNNYNTLSLCKDLSKINPLPNGQIFSL